MVSAGNATVYINSMDAAIAFYSGVLGMKVTSHFGDHWATVEAGGFQIGLHPKLEKEPQPGTHGSITIGLIVTDIEAVRATLLEGGAGNVANVVKGDGGDFVHFDDPDGNALCLWQMPTS